MYVQDIALPSGSNKNNKRSNRTQDYSSKSSIKSSHHENRDVWSDVESRHCEGETGESYSLSFLLVYSSMLKNSCTFVLKTISDFFYDFLILSKYKNNLYSCLYECCNFLLSAIIQ